MPSTPPRTAADGLQAIEIGVVTPAFVSAPIYFARKLGLFEREGLEVREHPYFATHAVTEALRGGEVPLAMTAPEGTIADALAGGPLRVCAGFVNKPPLSMIAQKRYRALEELKGARLGTTSLKEGTRHLIERMLAARGLNYPDDYSFVMAGTHPQRWKALQEGTIDAALQLTPFDYIAEAAGFPNLGAASDYVPHFAFCGLCVRADWAAANAALLVRLLRALLAAMDWWYADPDAGAAILVEALSADEAFALRACRDFTARQIMPRDLRMTREAFDGTVEAMRSSGELPPDSSAAYEAVCDFGYLDQAAGSG